MPSTVTRIGLYEALRDFGVDQPPGLLQVGDIALPTIQLQDLTFNYEPSVRARALMLIDLSAGGAGTFTCASIQAQAAGFWLLQARSFTTVGCDLQVNAIPWAVAAGSTGITMNIVGGAIGQATSITGANDFFPVARTNIAGVGVTNGFRIIGGSFFSGAFDRPLWVPGLTYLNVVSPTVNSSLQVALDLQVASNNTGRWA